MVLRLSREEVERSEAEGVKPAPSKHNTALEHNGRRVVADTCLLFCPGLQRGCGPHTRWLHPKVTLKQIQSGWVIVIKHPFTNAPEKGPPRHKPIQHNHSVLSVLWSSMWSCEETLNTVTANPSKSQNKLREAWLPLRECLSSDDRAVEGKRRERKKKKKHHRRMWSIRSWKWWIENNGWHRRLDERTTDWAGRLCKLGLSKCLLELWTIWQERHGWRTCCCRAIRKIVRHLPLATLCVSFKRAIWS